MPGKGSCVGLQQVKDIQFMEYKQLFQLNISANAQTIADVQSVTSDLEARIVFKLNAGNAEELQNVLRLVFLSGNSFQFWTELDLTLFEEKISESWLNDFAGLLCDMNYTKLGNKKLVGYNASHPHATKIISQIQAFLETQGFANILYIPIQEEIIIDDIYIQKAPAHIDDSSYQRMLHAIKNASYPLQLYFDISDLKNGRQNIHHFTENLSSRLSQEVIDKDMLSRVYMLKKTLDEQNDKNKTLHSTLITNNTYIDFLKSIIYGGEEEMDGAAGSYKYSEMIKIKRFYHYEYEILPLWYKRFGHILKVLTGKRTFRSLFNDNVQKYK